MIRLIHVIEHCKSEFLLQEYFILTNLSCTESVELLYDEKKQTSSASSTLSLF